MNGYACIGLDRPKNHINIGAVIRAATAFDVRLIVTSGKRYKKSVTDTTSGYKKIPLLNIDDMKLVIPYDCVPVAVELSDKASSIITYEHPPRAFYIFGSEDATLGNRITSWCRDIIYIPTKCCLNLAACVNVVLYDRLSKQQQTTTKEKVLK
jgi:tRNA(Leu) C34 or U34 (ribose-2'-O)-methylase TrmL